MTSRRLAIGTSVVTISCALTTLWSALIVVSENIVECSDALSVSLSNRGYCVIIIAMVCAMVCALLSQTKA